MSIILVIGGARSGKSSFAEKMANELSNNVAYIATAQALDEEMEDRIVIHKSNRPQEWTTYEEPLNVSKTVEKINKKHDVILLDCLTLLISNHLLKGLDFKEISLDIINYKEKIIIEELSQLLKSVRLSQAHLIIVTNEIGFGLVPPDPVSRAYRDIVGRANQFIAKKADQVISVCAGIPLQLKPNLERL